MEPIPTPREELTRKTVDVLTQLVHRSEVGRLDKSQLAFAGRLLWTVTAGLVDEDVTVICQEAARAGLDKPIKRHFVGKGVVRTVAWHADKPGYAMVTRDANATPVTEPMVRKTEIGERENELATLFASLRKAGYVEL